MGRKQSKTTLKFQFKPIAVPDDILTAYPTWQTVCVPVPVPLIPYLTPIMRIWQSPGCLQGTPEQKDLFIKLWTALIAQINSAGACQDGLMLRQNPLNHCQLQQSLDGGVTWLLAFDYSLCRSPILEYEFNLEVNQQFQQWSETTNNTEINQYAPTQTFTSSAGETIDRLNARKLALCYACNLYVAAYCEAIKKINADATALANLVNLGLGVAAAVAALGAAASGGATLPLYLALSAALGSAGVGAYSTLTDGVLNDAAARTEVACLMYSTLKDLEPTAENFATAVNSATLTGSAELIRATLANDISNPAALENQFNAFINLLGEQLRPAELGLINDCPCAAVTVHIYSDFNRAVLKESRLVFYGDPFDIEIDPAEWGSDEFFVVWGACLTYHYEVVEGTYTPTTAETAYLYTDCANVDHFEAPGTATDLPNDIQGRRFFMNANELDSSLKIVRITLTD